MPIDLALLPVSTRQPIVHIALNRILLLERTETNVSYLGSKIGAYLSYDSISIVLTLSVQGNTIRSL